MTREEIDRKLAELEVQLTASGPATRNALRPRLQRLMRTLGSQDMPVPRGLRRLERRMADEDDLFDNMPV